VRDGDSREGYGDDGGGNDGGMAAMIDIGGDLAVEIVGGGEPNREGKLDLLTEELAVHHRLAEELVLVVGVRVYVSQESQDRAPLRHANHAAIVCCQDDGNHVARLGWARVLAAVAVPVPEIPALEGSRVAPVAAGCSGRARRARRAGAGAGDGAGFGGCCWSWWRGKARQQGDRGHSEGDKCRPRRPPHKPGWLRRRTQRPTSCAPAATPVTTACLCRVLNVKRSELGGRHFAISAFGYTAELN